MKIQRLFHVIFALVFISAFINSQAIPSRDVSKEQAKTSQEWIRDAVIYQIFERQYSQKGDFNSITADLDRLNTLGVTVLWLMPVHPIGQEKKKGTIGSPYAVRDYYGVNPDYGTPDDLKRLIAEAHERGMKVIIDVVVNHTAWDNALIKTNPEFYKKNEKGEIIPPVADWADVAGLDYSKPAVRKYIIENLKSWVRDYGLDGFRCDVALMIPTDFWDEARAEVDKVKADTIWLAEAEKADLLVKAFDLDYSWELHHALDRTLHGDAPASGIRKIWEDQAKTFPKGSLRMRFSDNHDERRAIARFGEKGALAAQALIFTLDGVPLIYNGMENGDTTESGYPALFEKMPIFWQTEVRRPEFPKFYKAMVALRKQSAALRRGSLTWLKNSDENRVATFSRKQGSEEIIVAINLSNTPFNGSVQVNGTFQDITPDYGKPMPPDDEKARVTAKDTSLPPTLNLESYGFRIFRKK
ncbi:MAG: family 10 glycosylhydrolase [Acidobacteria bacterium]|nr:family 10 glycosylhydrolase [Acidobacteriota bacterium]